MDIGQIVRVVQRELPDIHLEGDWKFLRRSNGQYLVAHLAYDDQATDTEHGLACRVCDAADLLRAVQEIQDMLPYAIDGRDDA